MEETTQKEAITEGGASVKPPIPYSAAFFASLSIDGVSEITVLRKTEENLLRVFVVMEAGANLSKIMTAFTAATDCFDEMCPCMEITVVKTVRKYVIGA